MRPFARCSGRFALEVVLRLSVQQFMQPHGIRHMSEHHLYRQTLVEYSEVVARAGPRQKALTPFDVVNLKSLALVIVYRNYGERWW